MKHLLYVPILCFSLALSQDATASRNEITYTFTNCGQTGLTGPSQGQCDSEYGNDIDVNVNGGIQEWTVPYDGLYSITALGAQGGGKDWSSWRNGGSGAKMEGTVYLSAGTTLKILVGQKGADGHTSGGGGGGTFIALSEDTPLIVAGGGGGANYHHNGYDATPNDCGNGNCHYGSGCSGNGGTGCSYGSGGGGFYGNGVGGIYPGNAFINGGNGGDSSVDGGFGGGAGVNSNWYASGGGGYSASTIA